MVEWSFISHKYIYHRNCSLCDIKLYNTLKKWTSYFYTIHLPTYYPATQLIFTHVSLFYKLCHPLAHGPISNTTPSVLIAQYCLPYWLCRAWKVACLVNKSKPMHWLLVKNIITSKVKWWWRIYCTNGPDAVRCLMMMTDYMQLFD